MTIFSILSLLCRLFGFAQVADSLLKQHEVCVKAREVADAPKTKKELEDSFK